MMIRALMAKSWLFPNSNTRPCDGLTRSPENSQAEGQDLSLLNKFGAHLGSFELIYQIASTVVLASPKAAVVLLGPVHEPAQAGWLATWAVLDLTGCTGWTGVGGSLAGLGFFGKWWLVACM